jgi:hypothetical protein
MALKLSTGLVNFLAGGRSLRKAFDDAVLKIYRGVAPTYADDAPTGTLLANITVSSGAVAATDRGTPRLYNMLVGSNADGHTFIVDVTIDGATIQSATVTAATDTATSLATKLARALNDVSGLQAIATGADGYLYVQCEINGLALTLAKNTGSTGTLTVNSVTSASRSNALQLGPPTLGVITKNADTWSGVALATGTTGYYRLVRPNDGADADTNYTDYRIQGNVSTSGAELNMSNVNFVAGATQTIPTYTLTVPKTAS